MSDLLSQSGLFIDDLNKLRIVDPSVTQDTNELKEECEKYLGKVADFQVIVQNLLELVDSVAQKVEKQKLRAIGSRNLLTSIQKDRQSHQQQLESKILKKKKEIERLTNELQSLQRNEAEQTEFIERLLMGR